MAANTERQLVSFNLEEEKFGMDIMVPSQAVCKFTCN